MSPRTTVTTVVGLLTLGLGVPLGGCADSTCDFEGKTYGVGEQVEKDCNVCTCQENGDTACTAIACTGLDAGSASDAGTEGDAGSASDAASESDAGSASDAASDLDAAVGDGCYSPEQNLDRAYESGAVGCACTGDDSPCVASATGHHVSLSCSNGRWMSGEDGECAWAPAYAFDQYVVGESCRGFHINDRGEREALVLEVTPHTLSLWVQRSKGDEALSEWSIEAFTYETDEGTAQLIVTGHDLTFSRNLGPTTADPTDLQVALRSIAQNQWEVSVLNASALPDPLPLAVEWLTCKRDLVLDGAPSP